MSDVPEGAGWLFVEVSIQDAADAADRVQRLLAAAGARSSRVISDPVRARPLWRIREDGVGLAGRTAAGAQAWPGFEDAAVPPDRLGVYLRAMEELFSPQGLSGMSYGHGGSLSGKHGDGRARSELLPLMCSPETIAVFEQFKALFDPDDILNPGVIVRAAPLDRDLRRHQALPILRASGMAFAHDGGDFMRAVNRCVGVGKCRADSRESGGFMCPSYLATSDEKDSTRGRARVLQELANGTLVSGWSAPEVEEALDLCLSCKACSSDCPAGVDMAAYKSEALHRRYRRRLRPITHYVLGWLPRWARLASPIAPVVNAVLRIPGVSRLALALGGMDTRRKIPPSPGAASARPSADAGAREERGAASCCGRTRSPTTSRPKSRRRR